MRIILTISCLLTLIACTDKGLRPTVNYDISEDSLSVESFFADSTKMMIASFPFMFDSTHVLLQPSGLIDIKELKNQNLLEFSQQVLAESKSKSGSYTSVKNSDFFVTMIGGNTLSGILNNIYFDDLITGQQRLLTDKPVLITNVTYLSSIAQKTGKDYLLYTVYDKDTDKDGQLTTNDLKVLFISNLDGSEFKRVTKEDQDLGQTLFMDVANRYYFTTIEDVNRDGVFSNDDKYYYYYLEFSKEGYKLVEYNPLY